jgi:hypothetical protein
MSRLPPAQLSRRCEAPSVSRTEVFGSPHRSEVLSHDGQRAGFAQAVGESLPGEFAFRNAGLPSRFLYATRVPTQTRGEWSKIRPWVYCNMVAEPATPA